MTEPFYRLDSAHPALREHVGAPVVRSHVRVNVLTDDIFTDGRKIALSDREREVFTIIALRGGYMHAEAIAGAIWSHADLVESLKALRVYVSRLRRLIPDAALIQSEKNGYRLNADIAVDLWEIDRSLRSQRGCNGETLSTEDLEPLYRRLARFHETERIRSIRWPWFSSVELQIDSYRRETGLHLGRKLLEAGRVYEAHRIAQELVVSDPLCELSRELSIRVELALENYALAVRQYRSFESMLHNELRAQPSPRLRLLLASHLLA